MAGLTIMDTYFLFDPCFRSFPTFFRSFMAVPTEIPEQIMPVLD